MFVRFNDFGKNRFGVSFKASDIKCQKPCPENKKDLFKRSKEQDNKGK